MTTQHLTTFSLVDELRAKIRSLESAGAALAASEERWKHRALEAEAERDELATQQLARELSDDALDTIVDQSAELRRVTRERDALQATLLKYQESLGSALGAYSGPLLDAVVVAIREAKKKLAWPRRYHP